MTVYGVEKLEPGDVISARDAANIIGVHFTTIYRWIEKNEIVYIKFGGSFFIPVLEVERLKKDRENKKALLAK